MLFGKEKIDDKTRIYHILGLKFKRVKKDTPVSKMTGAKRDDALITLKCIRNLFSKINTVETIVLGASNARMGFVENEKSINFGIDAQDLYYSFKILEKYINLIPNLKNVVLYYQTFSPGHELEKSPQVYRTAYYSAFLDIPYKNKLIAMNKGVIELEKKLINLAPKLEARLQKIPYDLMTPEHPNVNPPALEQKWINRWLDLNKRNTQNFYLHNIFKLAKSRNCKVITVISPYNPRIKKQLPPSSELFQAFYEICSQYEFVQIYNAFDDNQYDENDFIDGEHMSRSGALKATAVINQYLQGEK